MSPIDLEALRGTPSDRGSQTVPDDGLHIARLEKITIWEGDKGERLITEWSNDQNTQWTSWNDLTVNPRYTQGIVETQELLDGLGVDRSKLTDENLAGELAKHQGSTYQVRTESRQGSQGHRWFTSTYIEQPISGRQETLDAPIDTRGLPERDAVPAGNDLFADDDIPF